MTGRRIIKAVSVADTGDVLAANAYRGAADLILFDAKPPRGLAGALPGGNGLAASTGACSRTLQRPDAISCSRAA